MLLQFALVLLTRSQDVALLKQILKRSYIMNVRDDRDLHLAIMADNRHAVEWLLARDGQRLCWMRIDIPAQEMDFSKMYFQFPFNSPSDSQSHPAFRQLTPLGLICLNQDADLVRLLMKRTNEERRAELIAQSSDLFRYSREVHSRACNAKARLPQRRCCGLQMHAPASDMCDSIAALLFTPRQPLQTAGEEDKEKEGRVRERENIIHKMRDILQALSEWRLFYVVDTHAQQERINPSLVELILHYEQYIWAESLLPALHEAPFLALQGDPMITIFDFLCATLPEEILLQAINGIQETFDNSQFRPIAPNTGALIGGLNICILRNRVVCCRQLCALLEKLRPLHVPHCTPVHSPSTSVNIFRATTRHVSRKIINA